MHEALAWQHHPTLQPGGGDDARRCPPCMSVPSKPRPAAEPAAVQRLRGPGPPRRAAVLLARNTGRDEEEYVVDVEALTIAEEPLTG